mmetsp:Transcript_10658/g.30052  ORF Transcript_10658/g.30052 Transcript_10658/m.30052 type:complete len:232 (-) Transcript_10658:11-706(-)
MMNVVGVVFLFLVLGVVGAESIRLSPDPPSPVLPATFTAGFDETMDYFGLTGATQGVLYYDSLKGYERMDRENGEADRYCGTAHLFSKTPCTHLIVDSTRWLIFPQRQSCCYCCDSADGCGIVKRDFLANATFVGYEEVNGTSVQHWKEEGLQENDYWQTDDQKPVRLYQKPNDDMRFKGTDLKPIDPSVFQVPDYCSSDKQCGGTCSFLRKRASRSVSKSGGRPKGILVE